jgi:predicted amidophosphoribosyltransferase
MLISCPECKKECSDEAPSCPHCGHPLKVANEKIQLTPANKRKAPIFLILSVIALVLTLGTPRFLVVFPIMEF